MNKELFIPVELSRQLILFGFNKNECIVGCKSGKIRFKITHTHDGDIIQWDNDDLSEPLILRQQAFEFFLKVGLVITPCSMDVNGKTMYFAMPHGEAEEHYSSDTYYGTIIAEIPESIAGSWQEAHDKALIDNKFVLDYPESEIQCLEKLILIYTTIKNG